MFCVYVQAMQGDYEEALKQAEAAMIATTSPAAYLLALGAKILSLMQCGRFGEVLRIVGTGRELAQKNGEDPWVLHFSRSLVAVTLLRFRRGPAIEQNCDAQRRETARCAMDSHRHDLGRLCGTLSGEIRRGIAVLRASTRPWDNAQFLSTLVLANAGPAWFE